MTDRRGPQRSEDRSDLTPEEARAEVEAFMGPDWASEAGASGELVTLAAYGPRMRVRVAEPTYRAAVAALKAAWRDAVRPWVMDAAQAGYDLACKPGINLVTKEACVARVLKEDQ